VHLFHEPDDLGRVLVLFPKGGFDRGREGAGPDIVQDLPQLGEFLPQPVAGLLGTDRPDRGDVG